VVSESENVEVRRPSRGLGRDVERRLAADLQSCPDLAFAYLADVWVPGRHPSPDLVLFAWLVPGALRSLRSALNLVSEAVARTIPEDQYLDVVILNSAPEMLGDLEACDTLLVERVPEERARALTAAESGGEESEPPRTGPWWWPF